MQVTIYIKDKALIEEARRLRINVSRVCEDAIRQAVEHPLTDEIHDLIWGEPIPA